MKHHLITDGHSTPLAVLLTDGNRNDVTQPLPLLDAIPPIRGRIGRPWRRPDSLFADRGYDHDIHHAQVRARGIVPAIARRGTRHPARHRIGHLPVGGRTDLRLAPRLPTSAHPLGRQSWHPRSVPQTRLLSHRPTTTRLIVVAVVIPKKRQEPVPESVRASRPGGGGLKFRGNGALGGQRTETKPSCSDLAGRCIWWPVIEDGRCGVIAIIGA